MLAVPSSEGSRFPFSRNLSFRSFSCSMIGTDLGRLWYRWPSFGPLSLVHDGHGRMGFGDGGMFGYSKNACKSMAAWEISINLCFGRSGIVRGRITAFSVLVLTSAERWPEINSLLPLCRDRLRIGPISPAGASCLSRDESADCGRI